MSDFQLMPIGERGMQLWLPTPRDSAMGLLQQQQIWRLAEQCRDDPDFAEVVPGMNNLTLLLAEANPTFDWQRKLGECRRRTQKHKHGARHHKIPVCYDGPDLGFIAQYHRLSENEVIRLHSQGRYNVYFLGFLPGFAYLGGLPEALATPRRENPRLQVPAGSVGIGGQQTGIYPCSAPGGWQLLGHTSVPLLDSEHCLLQPGDSLEFVISETGA
ncbi:5-oxoprolinase subunit PxpB [Shewanella cyperi]|uniref:5-oxoprolinase subunit PxpB n=1 Tax=Shewanella cyperi TaxID=2814292 RepID=UPI001A941ECF|nr:5-oxoprolinase subunit PxpB [Shewanella cyperi]QSX40891.1 5-oxoprolinase subunit PxpB [Shewanella cyperi]